MKKLNELLLKLPEWAHYIVGFILVVTVIILWVIIWDFISPYFEWLWPPLGYIFMLTFYGGITLFSGFTLVKFTIGVVRSIPTKFRETKIKQLPGLCGYLFIYIIWVLFTLTFLGATINTLLEPFGISLQSLGILPHLYSGYFLDHPVYIFGYKVIPIFD